MRMLLALGLALGGGDQLPQLQFPVSLNYGGSWWWCQLGVGVRRSWAKEVTLCEWKTRISLPGPHAPLARSTELKVSLRN